MKSNVSVPGFVTFACRRLACGALVATLMCLGLARVASAEDQAALAKVTELNKKALEAYDNLEPEEARKMLMQALEVCASAGLNSHPLKARTHVHLGVVLMGGFKQRDLAIRQFKRAFDIQPDIKLTKSLVNPETQAAFDEAKSGAPEPAVAKPEDAKPEPAKVEEKKEEPKPEVPVAPAAEPEVTNSDRPPARVKGIFHRPVTEARANEAITIKAAVAADLDFTKLIVAYRPEGASDFLQRPMSKDDKGWYVARIPDVATQGGLVSYYIEARAKGDKAIATNGSASEPHVVSINAAGAAATPEAAVAARSDHNETPHGGESTAKTIWFGLSVGTGVGYYTGPYEVNRYKADGSQRDTSGVGLSGAVHFVPQISFVFSDDILLSIEGRLQLVSGATDAYDDMNCTGANHVCSAAKGALAVLAKASYFLGHDAWRPYVAGVVGAGEIRYVSAISEQLPGCGGASGVVGTCNDTVLGGRFLFGPGAGLTYALADNTAFLLGANLLLGVPNFTANVDVNAGIAFGF